MRCHVQICSLCFNTAGPSPWWRPPQAVAETVRRDAHVCYACAGRGKWKGVDLDGNRVPVEYDSGTGSIELTAGVNVYQAYFLAPSEY